MVTSSRDTTASAHSHTEPPAVARSGRLTSRTTRPTWLLVQALVARHPGVELLHAATGRDGVGLVRREKPDFVLLDMNLPDISGLEVVRELNIEITSSGLRLNILTGNALSMDIIKAMSLGAYEYWLKPLTRQVFDDGLRRALTGRRPDPAHRIPVR